MLGVVEPGNLNGIGAPEWQEVEFTVDSGASETVMNMDTLPMIQAEEGAASKRGGIRSRRWHSYQERGGEDLRCPHGRWSSEAQHGSGVRGE